MRIQNVQPCLCTKKDDYFAFIGATVKSRLLILGTTFLVVWCMLRELYARMRWRTLCRDQPQFIKLPKAGGASCRFFAPA